MSVTIKDIAKIANVSHTTVSRALNDHPYIKQSTKEKIKQIAKELNYTPNYNAKSLVLDRSYNIGVFFSTIYEGTSPDFFYEVLRGVNQIIHGRYNMVVSGIEDYENFDYINKKNFDGIVLMSQSNKDNAFISDVIKKNIPLVILNRKICNSEVINILCNDRKGAYNATVHLIEKGHKRIGIIEGKKGFESTIERKEGFLQALSDYNIDIKNEYAAVGKYDLESGYLAMKELLNTTEYPTAVFCSSDDMAVGAMKAVNEKGLKVYDDISIIGFDGSIFSAYVSPALTTVKRPIERIGLEGAKKLLDVIEGKNIKKESIYINTELVIRDSVKNL